MAKPFAFRKMRIGIPRPLAQSSTISARLGTIKVEAIAGGRHRFDMTRIMLNKVKTQ